MNKYYRWLFYGIIPLFIVGVFAVPFIVSPREFETDVERLVYTESHLYGISACQEFVRLRQNDPLNPLYIYLFERELNSLDKKERKFFEFDLKKNDLLPNLQYKFYVAQNDSLTSSIGHFGKALECFYKNRFFLAENHLDSIDVSDLAGVSYLRAEINFGLEKYNDARQYYYDEMRHPLFRHLAEISLADCIIYISDENELLLLLENESISKHFSAGLERKILYRTGNYYRYFLSIGHFVSKNFSGAVLCGILVVLFVWIYYLLQVSMNVPARKRVIFIGLFAGLLTLYPTLFLYDFLWNSIGFRTNSNLFLELIYSKRGIQQKIIPKYNTHTHKEI